MPTPLSEPDHLVCFAHGKESGPWGTKITALAQIARRRGFEVMSPDYSHTHDPHLRVTHLLELAPRARRTLILVGSSMGGYVSAMACAKLRANGLLLLAPALYFPGFDEEPPKPPALTTVVHGWDDDIVPYTHALRYAQQHRAALHLLNGGHTLNERLPALEALFDRLLTRALLDTAYRESRYTVSVDDAEEIALYIGRVDAQADRRLAQDCGVHERWAIVTACNPGSEPLPPAENAQRMDALQEQIEKAKLRHFPAAGADLAGDWPAEASVLLCDPPEDFAAQLAARFGQFALVEGALGEAPRLRWLG